MTSRVTLTGDGARVDLWFADVEAAAPTELLLAGLSPDELARVSSFLQEADRRRSAVAHALLRDAVGAPLHVVQRCERCGGAHGRPRVVDAAGAERGGVHVSLTHTGALAGVAVAGAPVGVDAEALARGVPAGIERALAGPELEALRRLRDGDRPDYALRTWTRKEALLKAGCRMPFAAIDLSAAGNGGARRWSEWMLWDLTPAPGYIAAAAVYNPPRERSPAV